MNHTPDILSSKAHRPWPLPSKRWNIYQEWKEVLFLNWEVPFDMLRTLVPASLELDAFGDRYFVSIVPFSMRNVHPRGVIPVSFVSDFHEVNVRTYVLKNGKAGVYFLNIEAEKLFPVFLIKLLSGLPYEKAEVIRDAKTYSSSNPIKKYELSLDYVIAEPIVDKSAFEIWLTERYCLFLVADMKVYIYEIHHREWQLNKLEFSKMFINYDMGNIQLLNKNIHSYFYSAGVDVVSWWKYQTD